MTLFAMSVATFAIMFTLGYLSSRFNAVSRRWKETRQECDKAYDDRARILAVLAAQFESSLEHDGAAALDSEWLWVLIIKLPKAAPGGTSRQVSWHVKASDLWMFNHVPRLLGFVWDRHTTEEKNERMEQWCKERGE